MEPTEVTVTVELDEEPKSGAPLELSYQLSGAGREPVEIDLGYVEDLTWEGVFTLPADAGEGTNGESFSFEFFTTDDLNNESAGVDGTNQFQVYQGNLPPLDIPTGLTATALPGGDIQLSWNAVANASGYQLYRQAPGEVELTVHGSVVTDTTIVDSTAVDGEYLYSVSSRRTVGGVHAFSGMAEPAVSATADRVAPAPPENLALALAPQGVQTTWDPPAGGLEVNGQITYSLYRDALSEEEDIEPSGLTPVLSGIPRLPGTGLTGGEALDSSPIPDEHSYAVTAVDAAGNESDPSNTEHVTFDLLPVATLTVTVDDDNPPVVAWTHSSPEIESYRLYLGTSMDGLLLQESSSTSYADTGYSGDDRLYSVVAVDETENESLERSILLPAIRASLPEGTQINRGVFNRLEYQVTNDGTYALAGVHLEASVAGHAQTSEPFALDAGATTVVPVIVGGYDDIENDEPLTTSIEITPNPGEQVTISRDQDIAVGDSALSIGIETLDFTRGATGQVRFTVENTSAVETEIVMAEATGSQPSSELRIRLLDTDGNVLSTQSVKQYTGASVITLATQETVARIAPGKSFTSAWIEVDVPSASPDVIRVSLEIDALHYRLGQPEHLSLPSHGTSRETLLIDAPYHGEITDISPTSVFVGETVTITGRAVDAEDVEMITAPLDLILRVRGFERKIAITTSPEGEFEFQYTPEPGEAGTYSVAVLYPGTQDRPEQGSFTVNAVSVDPSELKLRSPRNYRGDLIVTVNAAEVTEATNVHFEYLAADQDGEELPEGIDIELPAAFDLDAGESQSVHIYVTPDNNAPEKGVLRLRLGSDESGTAALAMVEVDYDFSDAAASLFYDPSIVETGVVQDQTVSEIVTLENTGLDAFDNVTLTLLANPAADDPAPGWIGLVIPSGFGRLEGGQKVDIELRASPSTEVAPSIELPGEHYSFTLRAIADGIAYDIPIQIAVVSATGAALGGVTVHASDIYTDPNGTPLGLEGAAITLEEDGDATVVDHGVTDSDGNVTFTDLPAGAYVVRASATDHIDATSRIRIRPATTLTEEIFVMNKLVSFDWSLQEVPLEDRYVFVLNTTFQTEVPAAVLIVEPSSVVLPDLQQGEQFLGELTVTNYGLIQAETVTLRLPRSDGILKFEFLKTLPSRLAPHQRVTLPYRVTALQAVSGTVDGNGSGPTDNPCFSPSVCVDGAFQCINGRIQISRDCIMFIRSCENGAQLPCLIMIGDVTYRTMCTFRQTFAPVSDKCVPPNCQCGSCDAPNGAGAPIGGGEWAFSN